MHYISAFFYHLQSKALALGLEVPYFFSGLLHSSDPAGDALSFDDSSRPNPWFSTEFWSKWYSGYGSDFQDAKTYQRRIWKIIAHGGNDYNYYMAHGGTNFGYTNNNEDAASYDYGAAVAQAGDLRPISYSFKRIAWFARSFQNMLENSTDATLSYKGFRTDTAINVTARHSAAGDIIFFNNSSSAKRDVKLPTGNKYFRVADNIVTLKREETFPAIHNYKLNKAIIEWSASGIFGIVNLRQNMVVLIKYLTTCGNVGS